MKRLLFQLLFLLSTASVFSQQKLIVSGSVRDSLTGEPLIGAYVYAEGMSGGRVTDTAGNFTIEVHPGKVSLTFSYVGYLPKTVQQTVYKESDIRILLRASATEAGEVVVTARNASANTESTRTGIVELSAKEIGRLPTMMGEADLIRALHYSPGIQSSGDGNSGFYVRGGNVDQNLILLDNAVVYNPSHVLGFFSVFNSDVISNATLIKSGIPSNYGGRISSVLSVKTVDGDFAKHGGSGTTGLIYSKATLQGPVIRNKLSYVLSFRKSYVNEVVKPLAGIFAKPDSGGFLNGSSYGMYDLNFKLSGKLGSRDKLGLMFYNGRDRFSLNREDIDFNTRINWGNTILGLNWNHIYNDSNYMLNSLTYSKYDFSYTADQFIMSFDLFSSISNVGYRLEYNGKSDRFGLWKAGLEAKYYTFVPNRFMLTINKVALNYSSYQDLLAFETAGFVSIEKELSEKVLLSAGLRLNNYRQLGPYTMITGAESEFQDTSHYSGLQTVKAYTGPEPRLSVRYQVSPESSIKASYTRNYQYIHVASASAVTMPSDIWIPSTRNTPPQYGDQLTLGYYRNISDNTFETSVEAYYKKLHNQIELLYGLGASLQDISFENSLTMGKGYATGIEFFVQKPAGRFTGAAAYSLSYTERQFDEINRGKPFPAKYDRRHEINVNAAFKAGKRWELSAAFVYATGNAMTVPVQMYIFDNNINTEYGPTNSFRMPPYHRLDISATCNLRKTEKFESSLNFSVLNVYNRANPFLIFFQIEGDILKEHTLSINAKQISIFPVLPSVSWNFKF